MDSNVVSPAHPQLPAITPPLPSPLCNPPVPSNPPVFEDFLAATAYARSIYDYQGCGPMILDRVSVGSLDPAIVVDAYRYREEVLARLTGADVEPPWFQTFLQHFRNFEQRVNTFMIEQDIKTAVLQNCTSGDGCFLPYAEVRFANGSYPTQAPYNYPPLSSAAAIDNLSEEATNNYFDGYCPGLQRPQGKKEKRGGIKRATGCRDIALQERGRDLLGAGDVDRVKETLTGMKMGGRKKLGTLGHPQHPLEMTDDDTDAGNMTYPKLFMLVGVTSKQ